MSLDFNSKGGGSQEDIYENLKILATTIETLNQQIETKNFSEDHTKDINDKIGQMMNGLSILNTKLDYLQNNSNKTKEYIDERFIKFEKKYNEDIEMISGHLNKNTVILEFLKATVQLLDETVDILKSREK